MKTSNRSTKAERKAQQLANQEGKPFSVIARRYVYPSGSQICGLAFAPVFHPQVTR